MNRLHEKYTNVIKPKLQKDFNLSNVMEVPRIVKISVNSGIGSFKDNKEAVAVFEQELANICGQKPSPRKARLSVASFKIRKNETVGYTVTLRGERMWSFLDKFINVSLPRVRDFRGLSESSFDGSGNYSVGITEHVIFPEVNPNTTKGIRSMQITIVLSSNLTDLNKAVLREIGMPFVK